MLTFFFIPAKQLNAFFVIFLHKQIYVLIEKTDNLASLNYYKPTKKEKKEEKNGSLYKCERYSGSYKRVFSLTKMCDADKIEADYKDGVLTIQIPKKEPAPVKQINIK